MFNLSRRDGEVGEDNLPQNRYLQDPFDTLDSASVIVESRYFVASNIIFQNSAPWPVMGVKGAQVVAMRISGDKAAFYSCKFLGYQDTLCNDKGRHLFKNCFIQATRTRNCSEVELEGIVRSAVSFAYYRQISMEDLTKPLDHENIKVTMKDFLNGLEEIIPPFGTSAYILQRCRINGIVYCGERHKLIYERTMFLVEQVKVSKLCPLVTCLLEGPDGSGKTAMAATIGIDSDFPYVEIVSAESMIDLTEHDKCAKIIKVFDDAYKSELSIVILDDIERLLEYCAIGPCFSSLIAQTLQVLLKRLPPKGKNLLVIGTTSEVGFLGSIGLCKAFSVTHHVPALAKADVVKVLEHLNVFIRDDIDAVAEALNGMPLKQLYAVVDKAVVRQKGRDSEAIYSGKEKIDRNQFLDTLSDYASFL